MILSELECTLIDGHKVEDAHLCAFCFPITIQHLLSSVTLCQPFRLYSYCVLLRGILTTF